MKDNEKVINENTDNRDKVFPKNADIAGKKISDKCKKIRNTNNISVVEEIQEVASKKSAQIAAKNVSDKYKKMRYKKPPPPFNLNDIADAESVIYTDDRNMENVRSNRGATIAANKIKINTKK